jgi:hypothetical protein
MRLSLGEWDTRDTDHISSHLSHSIIIILIFMKKILIAGLATLSIAGTAFIGTSIYAANTGTTQSGQAQSQYKKWVKNESQKPSQGMQMRGERMNPENMIQSLSGKVSPEALTALQSLMQSHKATMDTLHASGTTVDQATLQSKHTEMKASMDALMTKYPELKTALWTLPAGGMDKMWGNNEIDTLMSSLSTADQSAIKAIRDEYRTKQEALRTEEKSKIDTIIAKYPDVKTKLDTLEKSRPESGGRGMNRGGKMMNHTSTPVTTAQ